MNNKSLPIALSIALGFGLTGGVLVASQATAEEKRSVGQTIDDATITAGIKTKLLDNESTKGFDINVDTRKGIVTLEGGADSELAKATATRIALSTEGVRSVDNRIVVAPEGSLARLEANKATLSGEARAGAADAADASKDAWLTTKVKSKLLAEGDVDGTRITVETRNEVVHLSGVIESSAMKAMAIRLAESTEGVRSVDASNLKVAKS